MQEYSLKTYLERRLKMKAFKRIFASVMVTAMLATMGVSAFAGSAQTRGALCEYCGVGELILLDTYTTPWTYLRTDDCNAEGAHDWMKDTIESRKVISTYECSSCRKGVVGEYTETRRLHMYLVCSFRQRTGKLSLHKSRKAIPARGWPSSFLCFFAPAESICQRPAAG